MKINTRIYKRCYCNRPGDREERPSEYFWGRIKLPRFIGEWLWNR